MVIAMIAVALRRHVAVLYLRADRVGAGRLLRIFLAILLQEFLLGGLRERVDGVARLGFARRLGYGDTSADGHDSFAADELESGILAAAVDEVHAQCEIECRMMRGLGIVVETKQHVGDVAAVFPEA